MSPKGIYITAYITFVIMRKLLSPVDEVTMWLKNGGRNNIFYDENITLSSGEDKNIKHTDEDALRGRKE